MTLAPQTARMARRVIGFGTSIFSEMSRLAREHHAVNLSQGFPDFDPPVWVRDAAKAAIDAGANQYAVSHGQPRLREAIAGHSARYSGLHYDVDREITVTSGCTEAIFDTMLALVNPGDEVIAFEPAYDSYGPAVIMAGGTPRFVPLHAPDWAFDPAELAATITPQTRLILLNTPHNPTGKVFTRAELEGIAALAQAHDLIVVTDEVYEHLVFPPAQHISIATLPGMRERTITLSSAGKTFSLTGWKIGWALAPPDLSEAIRRVHQFVTFASATPFQEALATAIETAEHTGYFSVFLADYTARGPPPVATRRQLLHPRRHRPSRLPRRHHLRPHPDHRRGRGLHPAVRLLLRAAPRTTGPLLLRQALGNLAGRGEPPAGMGTAALRMTGWDGQSHRMWRGAE
jgi:aspartate/methionine/tyrosine aminotransferase